MKSFKEFLMEGGGEAPGKLEVLSTPLEKARKFAFDTFQKYGRNLDEEIPNFDKNYLFAQRKAGMGKTKRRDMPVINDTDVRMFQKRLSEGYIDVTKPYGIIKQKVGNPFPEGLKGEDAKLWLEDGLKIYDGEENDDIVKVYKDSVRVGDLKPIQEQIYFDKSISATANFGVDGTTKFLKNTLFITSGDNYIIDGHHRFLSGVLINPDMKITSLKIDLPIKILLPLSLAYGDAIGNERNL